MIARLLERVLGRLPIGWLQLRHNRGRLAAAVGGVAFANILVFMQLGFLGALVKSIGMPYEAMQADILISAADMHTMADGGPLPRQRMVDVLTLPGVKSAEPLYYARLDWKQPDGTIRAMDVFGVDPMSAAFSNPQIARRLPELAIDQTALVDRRTRNVDPAIWQKLEKDPPYSFEVKGRRIDIVDSFDLGGGFSADGYLIVSDQTFFKLFPQRSSGAPNHLLVALQPGAKAAALLPAIRQAIAGADSRASLKADVIAGDQAFQTTQRPVGLVFGFGLVIGVLVGMIIVYQILSADVADHLREYATLKAIGYRQRFFLGVVVEEAVLLATLGFIPGFLMSSLLYMVVAAKTGLPLHMDWLRPTIVLGGTLAACMASGAFATRKLQGANPADLF